MRSTPCTGDPGASLALAVGKLRTQKACERDEQSLSMVYVYIYTNRCIHLYICIHIYTYMYVYIDVHIKI